MTTDIVGGLRVRLVYDSVFYGVQGALQDIGWLDAGRQHLPITLVQEDVTLNEEVDFNTLAVFPADLIEDPLEMGSILAEHRRQYFIDFFAEGSAVGEHLIFDLRDALQGRMKTTTTNLDEVIPLLNYSLATPVEIGKLDIENVIVDKAPTWTRPWQRYWYSITMIVVDCYDGEPVP